MSFLGRNADRKSTEAENGGTAKEKTAENGDAEADSFKKIR